MKIKEFAETMIQMSSDAISGVIDEQTYVSNIEIACRALQSAFNDGTSTLKCGCGAGAEICSGSGDKGLNSWVECNNCGWESEKCRTSIEAVIAWNKMIRGER